MATINWTLQHWTQDAVDWTADNPVLLDGQFGHEGDTGLIKIGDGVTAWNSLSYIGGGAGAALTRVDDTNVTLTLGGSPTTALLAATSLTLGWTGQLAASRGGTGISSLGAGIATWLGTPSSANLASAITDETGSGALVFANTPTLVTPILGTPTSGTLTNCTGLPSIVVANEASDTTCFPLFTTAATGELGPKTNSNLAFNSNTGVLTLTAPILGTPTSGTLSNCSGYPESWMIACSDETTALTTGTSKASFSFPYAVTVLGVYATVNTAPTGSTLNVDINEAGVSILSTVITIDVSEFTGGSSGYQGTAATAAVISDSSIAAFAQITIDIDQVGSTIAGKGLKVCLIVKR